MYDPVISSFLSVDRYVQQPENSQGFNRYAYCMYNPLKYVDPSGWRQSLPNGHGIAPPPDGDETGYYVTGVYTYTGFNNEYYSYNYGLNEVTVTPYGNSWAMEECRRLGEQNCGGLSAEYSGGEANVPTLSAGGGGGGGFWTGGNNTSTKSEGLSSNTISYTVSYAGLVTGYKKSLWEKPLTRAQKAINQKKAYNTQKALKAKGITKSVKEIKAGKIANLKAGGIVVGVTGIGLSVYDIIQSGEINVSNGYNTVVAGLCMIPGAGWIIGGVSLTLDLAFYGFTGESFGDNLGHWFGDPSWKFPE